MKNYFIFLITLIIGLSACSLSNKSTSNKTTKIGYKKLNSLVQKNDFKFKYFYSKVRVNYNNQTFTANIKMKKDSIIWMSLTGPFNIEGARVKITPSKFQMIDKMNRVYYDMPLSFVENYIPITADFTLLENLILGNSLEKVIKKQKIETIDNKYIVKGDISSIETKYLFLSTGKLNNAEIIDSKNNKRVEILFDKYEKLDNQDFALKRKFLITDKEKNYLLDLKFYKYKKQKLEFPFNVPSSYVKYKQ